MYRSVGSVCICGWVFIYEYVYMWYFLKRVVCLLWECLGAGENLGRCSKKETDLPFTIKFALAYESKRALYV